MQNMWSLHFVLSQSVCQHNILCSCQLWHFALHKEATFQCPLLHRVTHP